MTRKTSGWVWLGIALSVGALTACSGAESIKIGQMGVESAGVAIPTPSEVDPSSEFAVAPMLAGLSWPEAQSRGASEGFTLIPTIAGAPGPLRIECRVVQQTPAPGENLLSPVLSVLLFCPPQRADSSRRSQLPGS